MNGIVALYFGNDLFIAAILKVTLNTCNNSIAIHTQNMTQQHIAYRSSFAKIKRRDFSTKQSFASFEITFL